MTGTPPSIRRRASRGRRPARVGALAAVFVGSCLLALLAGCAVLSTPGAGPPPQELTAPWVLPAQELGGQGLFRVSFEGAEDSGSFRLTLLLQSAERYQVRAVDPLGRALWTLDADGERGLWIDHRNEVACTLTGSFDLAAARLAPFPLTALPALLLGRLPAAPAPGETAWSASETAPPRRDARLDYRDERGRRWTARLEGGEPVAWTLWEEGSPSLWWVLRDGEAFLSDPRRGNQLRWRRTLREALPAALVPLAVPDGFRQASCDVLYGGS